MRKITSLITLGCLLASANSANAQVTAGDPITITVNTTTGSRYRNNALHTGTSDVGKWVSTQVPGLSLEYNNGSGLTNQMNITATNVNLAWMNNAAHQYIIRLTGDDAIRYKMLGYTAQSTQGKLITTNAPTATDHTFTTANSSVTVNYTSEVSEMRFRNGTAKPGDKWVNGRLDIRLQKYETRKVVFVIKEGEQVVHTTDSMLVRLGPVVIPAALKRPATTLSPVTQTVDANTQQVVLSATFLPPFDKASQDANTRYFFRDGNNHYINHRENQDFILTTITKQYNDNYYWRFQGNPYTGVTIQSVANSGYLKKKENSNRVVSRTDITAENAKWEVNFNNVTPASYYTIPSNTTGFTLKDVAHRQALNVSGADSILTFWGNIDANSLFFVERVPDTRVAYIIKNEGVEIFRDSIYVDYGLNTIPTALTRPLTTLSFDQEGTVVSPTTQEIVLNAVFSPPFDNSSAGKKFLIRDKNDHYISHQNGDFYTLTKIRNFPTAYQWLFEGNPYTGVSIKSAYNHGYLKKNDGNDYVIAQTGITAADAKWEVNFNNVRPHNNYDLTTPPGGFTLKDVVKGQALNVHGGTSKLSFWEYVDANSLFFVDLVPEDLRQNVIDDFSALIAMGGNAPFGLKTEAYSTFQPLYEATIAKQEYVTGDDYSALRTIAANNDNYALPETGYYRMKNANVENRYVFIHPDNTDMLRADRTGVEALRDPSTIIYVEKQADYGKYLLKTSGKTIATGGENNTAHANNGTFQEVTMSVAGAGKGHFQVGTGNNSFLFYWTEQAHRLHTYSKDYNGTGQWSLEPATSLSVRLNAHENKSYATACFPFPVSINTAGVKAYNVAHRTGTTHATMTELSTDIPAGTPMLLVSETGADSVVFNIGTAAPVSTEPTGSFKSNFIVKTVQAESVMTFGRSIETPATLGFYKYTGTRILPFRAYFTTAEIPSLPAGANGFSLDFNDLATGINRVSAESGNEAPIYDLSGRRVTSPNKGIYIVNGKKVLF